MIKYPLTCTISLKGLVAQITRKYTNSERVQIELQKYGIFLTEDELSYRCEDQESPFCGSITMRLI